MNRLKNILVGIDFSPCSAVALNQAVRMARWNNARLQIVHVVNVMIVREYAEAIDRPLMLVEKEIEQAMRGELKRWLAPADVGAAGETVIGMPLDVLLRKARELESGLLVLGLHGGSNGCEDPGSIALKCLRKAQTKVMLVHPEHGGHFQKVVACVDFSETSHEAVEQALRVGEQDQSEIHFIHVLGNPWRELRFATELPLLSPEQERNHRAAQQDRLRAFVGDTRGLRVTFSVVEAGSVFRGIAEYARRVNADLLITGGRGQSDLKYLLLGSTVEHLLNELPCSALVVRLPGVPVHEEAREFTRSSLHTPAPLAVDPA
jgi:nucleotide-binding universal stress UspA family protein